MDLKELVKGKLDFSRNYNCFVHFDHMTTVGGFKYWDQYYILLSDIEESMLGGNFDLEVRV